MVKTVQDQGNSIAAPSSDIYILSCAYVRADICHKLHQMRQLHARKKPKILDHSKLCKKNCQEIDPHILIEHFIKAS
jgi:hypothetical protein